MLEMNRDLVGLNVCLVKEERRFPEGAVCCLLLLLLSVWILDYSQLNGEERNHMAVPSYCTRFISLMLWFYVLCFILLQI